MGRVNQVLYAFPVGSVLFLWKAYKMSKRKKRKPKPPHDYYDLTKANTYQAIAKMFEQWSVGVHRIRHGYSADDDWCTLLPSGYYERVANPKKIDIYVKKYLGKCHRIKDGSENSVAITPKLVSGIIDNLEALDDVYISKKAPSYLGGAKRDITRVLAFNNCLLDISHYPPHKIEPSSKYYILDRKEYNYERKTQCPQWKHFLRQIFETDDDKDPSIKILQEMFGLLLIPETKHQKIFALVGPKRSGKGTIIKILQQMLGASTVTTTNLTNLPTPFGMQNLIGKSVAIIPDVSFDSKRINMLRAAEILKSVSGEDPIEIQRKYKKAKEYVRLPVRFLLVSNAIQALSDPTGALASRFIYLVTTQSFYGKEDKDLANKLSEELPGIFIWALRGLRRLEKRGRFLESKRGVAAKEAAAEKGSAVITFVNHCCVEGSGGRVEKQKLHTCYRKWAIKNGAQRLGRTEFYHAFMSAFPTCLDAQIYTKDSSHPKGQRKIYVFRNVRLRRGWRSE